VALQRKGGPAVDALINIDVPNLEQAIRFYEAAVGLRLSRRLFGDKVAEMIGASSPIYLITKPEGSSPIPEPGHGRRQKTALDSGVCCRQP
jgi:catechol 2,3-dioxygenase-like lactoylglutathione lyase family enzyme